VWRIETSRESSEDNEKKNKHATPAKLEANGNGSTRGNFVLLSSFCDIPPLHSGFYWPNRGRLEPKAAQNQAISEIEFCLTFNVRQG
jgi:hypothetical protein